MSKRNQIILALALIAVGVSGLVGVGAFAAPGAVGSAQPVAGVAPTPPGQPAAVQGITQPGDGGSTTLEGRIREMVQEHMGISGADADKLVQRMADHMRDVHGDQADGIAGQCAAAADGDGPGAGMMGGSGGDGSGYGGMMGGSGGAGSDYRGMMGGSGGGMMGGI